MHVALHILFVNFMNIKSKCNKCSRMSPILFFYISQGVQQHKMWWAAVWHGFCCKFLRKYNSEKKWKSANSCYEVM